MKLWSYVELKSASEIAHSVLSKKLYPTYHGTFTRKLMTLTGREAACSRLVVRTGFRQCLPAIAVGVPLSRFRCQGLFGNSVCFLQPDTIKLQCPSDQIEL